MTDTFNAHAQVAVDYAAADYGTAGYAQPQPDSGAELLSLVKITYQENNEYGSYVRASQLTADEAIVLRDALIALNL